ncbi:Lysophospholipase L1 [Psychrobacillus sp. OK028]|uniref:S-layer homology domain-containing protein n=1 Tax=Psychrobacillus sp. OK028 TaxID=1884359 RepID=UPI000881D98E|nr:S-layer homology domain-containing protein [Psychrobacillus sp. OK028]SDM38696.1 Lysophospholipase L1 [Psychrobacillus sp. OK028]
MGKKMYKLKLLFVLVLFLQLVAMPSYTFAAEADTEAPTWVKPLNYLALGDSLAVGVTPENQLGKGYTDLIAESLKSQQVLQSFNKGFTFPGYKTSDILKDLQDNVTKPVFGTGIEENNAELHKSITAANLITISAGANDVLAYFKVDATTGAPVVDLAKITSSIQQVGVNYSQILKAIYAINPNVQVYIMGYYNPFPQVDVIYQPQIAQLLTGLNGSIQASMKGTNATFIATHEKIAENYTAHLPNPKNIHLSEAGYKVVADLFNQKLVNDYPWVSKETLTVQLANKTTAKLNWNPASDNTAVTGYIIYNGKEKVAELEGHILNFDVKNLQENKSYTFSVAARDAAGNISALNPSATITTGATPALFSDIKGHPAKDYIMQAAKLGVVNGYTDGTFKPNDKITRKQAASIIVNTLGLKAGKAAPYTDIKNYSSDIQTQIAAAHEAGIVKGSNGKFRPNDYITRAQLALMLKRSYEYVNGKPYVSAKPAPFSDIAHFDDETKTAISMLSSFQIVDGAGGKFLPNDSTTRAHAAKIFVNFSTVVTK